MSYWNTNKLAGESLSQAIEKAKTQETKILLFFKSHPHKSFAPHEIGLCLEFFLKRTPITSIRRAITNLERSGQLMKTDRMINGQYGKPVHTWRFKPIKKPVQPALF